MVNVFGHEYRLFLELSIRICPLSNVLIILLLLSESNNEHSCSGATGRNHTFRNEKRLLGKFVNAQTINQH